MSVPLYRDLLVALHLHHRRSSRPTTQAEYVGVRQSGLTLRNYNSSLHSQAEPNPSIVFLFSLWISSEFQHVILRLETSSVTFLQSFQAGGSMKRILESSELILMRVLDSGLPWIPSRAIDRDGLNRMIRRKMMQYMSGVSCECTRWFEKCSPSTYTASQSKSVFSTYHPRSFHRMHLNPSASDAMSLSWKA